MPPQSLVLPAYCRVEGVINRRKGVGGEEFGIQFALAMPDQWNGDFLMQGGGRRQRNRVSAPRPNRLGRQAGAHARLRRGQHGHRPQKPQRRLRLQLPERPAGHLDFAYEANAEVAALAKQIIAQYYGKSAAYSYFTGCSTGGREGMVLSQRFPTEFDGIIVGDPAMRTGLSNLAIGEWIPAAFNQIAPKDSNGKPIITQAITDDDRKLSWMR